MSVRRNPREMFISQVEVEFTESFLALEKKYELTYGEMFELLSKRLARIASDLVSEERKEED